MSDKIIIKGEDATLVLAAIRFVAKDSSLSDHQRASLRNLEKRLRAQLRDDSRLRLDGAAVSVILRAAMFVFNLIENAT